MRLLALQPYDAASHRALLAGWQRHSRHLFTVLSMPGRHFKWRMRQAPIELARQIETRHRAGEAWDALWCTSMLDLASLRGLSPAAANLPAAIYFHENQLAYPTRHDQPRDLHFGMTNMTAALSAIASQHHTERGPSSPCIWWNSAYNRDSFLVALAKVLTQMPDHRPMDAVDAIRKASAVYHPGIEPIECDQRHATSKDDTPLLLWAARWEHDKGPELFFSALELLDQRGVAFRVSVIGEQFAQLPDCFESARHRFADRIVHWGYRPTRQAYEQALRDADVVVSTALHEFFGIAVAEAVSAGCAAVLPDDLAYPELWGGSAVYHDQTADDVADAIEQVLGNMPSRTEQAQAATRFTWSQRARRLDDAIEALV